MTTKIIDPTATVPYDYTSLQAWIDACPSDLRAGTGAGTTWRGECKRALFTTSSTDLLVIANILTDATHYVELTTYAGASFRDNATKQTDPLRYDSSKGAALSCSAAYKYTIRNLVAYTRISNLMIQQTSTQGYTPVELGTNLTSWIDSCIVEGYVSGTTGSVAPISAYGPGSQITNCLVVLRGSGQFSIVKIMNGAEAHNCTFVVPSDLTPATNGNMGASAASVFENCAFFGCGTVWAQGNAPSFTACATNVASPPSGCTTIAYNTTTFVSTVAGAGIPGTHDFRLPLGSALINIGALDGVTPLDIVGSVRVASDIGCWEYQDVAPPSGVGPYYPGSDITVAGVTNNWTTSTGLGTLASMLDDTDASHYDDDYAQSGPIPINDTFEVKFAGVATPTIGSTVQIIYRIKATGTVQITVTLRCGASDTLVATWVHSNVRTDAFDPIVKTLTPAEQALITDYTDLRLRFSATATA